MMLNGGLFGVRRFLAYVPLIMRGSCLYYETDNI